MMSTSPPCARTWAAGMDAVAVLPPPVPTAMNRCGSSSCRSAIHFRPPARVARWILWAGRSYPSNRASARPAHPGPGDALYLHGHQQLRYAKLPARAGDDPDHELPIGPAAGGSLLARGR
jgi:hypothetical protein